MKFMRIVVAAFFLSGSLAIAKKETVNGKKVKDATPAQLLTVLSNTELFKKYIGAPNAKKTLAQIADPMLDFLNNDANEFFSRKLKPVRTEQLTIHEISETGFVISSAAMKGEKIAFDFSKVAEGKITIAGKTATLSTKDKAQHVWQKIEEALTGEKKPAVSLLLLQTAVGSEAHAFLGGLLSSPIFWAVAVGGLVYSFLQTRNECKTYKSLARSCEEGNQVQYQMNQASLDSSFLSFPSLSCNSEWQLTKAPTSCPPPGYTGSSVSNCSGQIYNYNGRLVCEPAYVGDQGAPTPVSDQRARDPGRGPAQSSDPGTQPRHNGPPPGTVK